MSLLEAVEFRRAEMGWPTGIDVSLHHLLQPPFSIDRCDDRILVLHCSKFGSSDGRDALNDFRRSKAAAFEQPVVLRDCDHALGFVPKHDISRDALMELARQRRTEVILGPSDPKIGLHGSPQSEWDRQRKGLLEEAVASPFYFTATDGQLLDGLRRSAVSGGDGAGWLDSALGEHRMSADSLQRDSSVVAHTHAPSWLYLATGLKLWFLSPYEQAPPAEVQWSLPLDSWLQAGSNSSALENWAPLVCMQRPGDVLVLPAFWYHATASLGATLAVGRQHPVSGWDMPPLIRQMNEPKKNVRASLDTQWAMLEANPHDGKLLHMISRSVKRYSVDQERLSSAVQGMVERAAALAAQGVIGARDAENVRESLEDLVQ